MSAEILDLSESFRREQDSKTSNEKSVNTPLWADNDNYSLSPLEKKYSNNPLISSILEQCYWDTEKDISEIASIFILDQATRLIKDTLGSELNNKALEEVTFDIKLELSLIISDIIGADEFELTPYNKTLIFQKYSQLGFQARVDEILEENVFEIIL